MRYHRENKADRKRQFNFWKKGMFIHQMRDTSHHETVLREMGLLTPDKLLEKDTVET